MKISIPRWTAKQFWIQAGKSRNTSRNYSLVPTLKFENYEELNTYILTTYSTFVFANNWNESSSRNYFQFHGLKKKLTLMIEKTHEQNWWPVFQNRSTEQRKDETTLDENRRGYAFYLPDDNLRSMKSATTTLQMHEQLYIIKWKNAHRIHVKIQPHWTWTYDSFFLLAVS